MSARSLYLFLHVLGVVLWLGLALALPFVTGRARREGDPAVVAFAYRAADRLMRTLGLTGILLTMIGGIGLTVVVPGYGWFQPFPNHWLFQMQLLGFLAFAVAAFYQLPLGKKLAREAERCAEAGEGTDLFETYRKRHAIVGSVNGLLLLVVVVLGTIRPG